jgi:asparagine synthase (glutamine-hydrolysing)
MCGIWALLGSEYNPSKHEEEFLKIVGRGPDLTVVSEVAPRVWLGFHRLAIVQVLIHTHILTLKFKPGDEPCEQPIVAENLSVVCNGEIYNHLQIKDDSPIKPNDVLNGSSDCAAIIHAFRTHNNNLRKCCASLDGVFAFLMADQEFFYIGRDPIGVRPLFYGQMKTGIGIFKIF